MLLVSVSRVSGQYEIESNDLYEGDFQGKDEVHNWNLELKESFNDFRVQVESRTGEVRINLIPANSNTAVKLTATRNKGNNHVQGVYGNDIEARLQQGKIPAGRYFVQVKPRRDKGNLGVYSLKVFEPKLGGEAEAKEPAPAKPAPPTAPAAAGSDEQGAILSELRALRKEVRELKAEVKSVREELAGKEKRPADPAAKPAGN